MTSRKTASFLLISLIFTLAACSEDATGPSPALVEALAGSGQTAEVGTKLPTSLAIRVVDARGFPVRNAPVTWTATAANGSITVIDAVTDRTGLARADWVIGTKIGTHTITAQVAGLAPVTFLANATPGAAAVIALNRDSLVARNLGDTLRVTAAVTDRFGNSLVDQAVTYTSTNEAIATVSTTGLITTRGRGLTTITARRGNASITFRVRVVEIARVVITPAPLNFSSLNQTQQLSARVEDAQGVPFTNVPVTWNASNQTVVAVSSTGVARAVGNGTAQVTATADGIFGTAIASVTQLVSTVVVTPSTLVVGVGTSMQLTATARDAGGSAVPNQAVIWTVSNNAIATISTSGLLTGATRGTVNVTAQVGNFTVTTPVQVTTLFTQIAAGDSHTCAIGAVGPLQPSAPVCWGSNLQGRLGTGSDDSATTPQDVGGGLTVSRIATGAAHSCGLATGGLIFCWGYNGLGQLGNATATDSNVPVQTIAAAVFTQVSTGQTHTCAVSNVNQAYCWGSHSFGQLGVGSSTVMCGTTPCQQGPAAISGGLTIRWVAAGIRHSCGIVTPSGTAYCWGFNGSGQLGTGNNTASTVPVAMASGLTFTELAAGNDFTCGLSTDGRAYCWGRNDLGQLGNGAFGNQTSPTAVASGLNFVQIGAGGTHACGRTSIGQIWCWGANPAGQLGNGTLVDAPVPVLVQAPDVIFSALATGREHTCAVTNTGLGMCWGRNTAGQLGDGTAVSKSLPTRVR